MSARKPSIQFTQDADDDIKNISLYTWQNWGEEQATIYEGMIGKALESLREYQLLGQPHDDLFPGCRSVRVGQHVIYYHQPRPQYIEIIRILHGRQDPTGNVEGPAS